MSRFGKYTWLVLAYTVAVILWGAYVRATGSGAGCGAHWPLCNGQVVPLAPQIETIIEFAHRLTSGLSGLLVLVMLIWALRLYPKGHVVRFGALLSFVFIVMEGLVGASLVLFEWVAHNASVARAVATAVHFTNTLFLLTALTLTAWWANGGQRLPWRQQGQRTWLTGLGLLALIILGSSGAINALGDTLFPVGSLREGIQQDFAPTAHFLVQLRIWHPILAIGTSLYLWLMSQYLTADNAPTELKRWTRRLKIILIVQLLVGFSNVLLLAPIWLQIVHLLLADLVLITFVLFAATVLVQAENRVNVRQLAPQNGD